MSKKPKQKVQIQGKKDVRQGVHVPEGKFPRSGVNTGNTNREKPVWKFEIFDHDGPWGKELITADHAWSHLYPKLKNYESMRWGEIEKDKKRNHSVPKTNLIKEARDRLDELKLNDIDGLFRFRLNGEQRLWGIRDGFSFRILWWDPDHKICPSVLKHT
ncbi:MAG: hypothetical protein WEB58_13725 [Planctomycetaceae bacterium]